MCHCVIFWDGPPWDYQLSRRYSGKESACQCRRHKRCGFDPCFRKIPWRRKWQPMPVFLPGKLHGQRSLVGYSLWGVKSQAQLSAEQQQQFWDYIYNLCMCVYMCVCVCINERESVAQSCPTQSACNVEDLGSIPRLERSPGEGIGYPLQYSWASLVAPPVKNLPAMQEMQETWVWPLGG